MKHALMLAAAVILLPACSTIPRDLPDANPAVFFPLDQGWEWTYRVVENSGADLELTHRMRPAETRGGVTYFRRSNDPAYYFQTDAGLFSSSSPGDGKTVVPFLKSPLRIGAPWIDRQEEKVQGKAIVLESTTEITGEENVTTPAGTFSCLVVRLSWSGGPVGETPRQGSSTCWYARGIGLVRSVANVPAYDRGKESVVTRTSERTLVRYKAPK